MILRVHDASAGVEVCVRLPLSQARARGRQGHGQAYVGANFFRSKALNIIQKNNSEVNLRKLVLN